MGAPVSKSIKSVILLAMLLLIAMPPITNAADFVIGLSDMSVNPSTIYSGDTITVKATYSVSSTFSAKVRLELLFDGNIIDSSVRYIYSGTYDSTFTYRPDSTVTGSHTIGIRARTYDGDILKDQDIITRSIQINPSASNHSIEIDSIVTKSPVLPSESFPVTVYVKNTGNTREDSLVVSAKINGNSYLGRSFSIATGESSTQIVYVTAPPETGHYEIDATVYNALVSESAKTSVDVQSASISLTLAKTAAETGEWIKIYGYAMRGNLASETAVSLYVDDAFSGLVPTRGNGYYETSLKFGDVGNHKILVLAAGLATSQFLYITGLQAVPPAAVQPTGGQPAASQGNYTAIITITGDSQYTIYPGAGAVSGNVSNKPDNKYANFSFVNIDVSANELDVVQDSGNTLKVTITNHLGKSEMFSVSSDFNQKWTYVPGADVIPDSGKKVFEIYFAPDKAGTFSGNIFVAQKGRIIKTVPLSLFVAPRASAEIKESLPIMFNIGAAGIAVLAAAVILAVLAIHFGLKKPRALEPKMAPPQNDISQILGAMSGRDRNGSKKAKERQDIFFVPRDNILS